MRTNPPDRRSHVRHRYGVRAGSIQDSGWSLIVRIEESASGHLETFANPRTRVCHAPINRHSVLSVGNAAVGRPKNGPGRTHALCQQPTLVDAAANFRFEPKLPDAAQRSNWNYVPESDVRGHT